MKKIVSSEWTSDSKRLARVVNEDGTEMFVPTDPANVDFAALGASNLKIADAAAPVPTVSSLQLALWLARQGKSDADVTSAIMNVADQTARFQALAYWAKSHTLRADQTAIATIWKALGLATAPAQAFSEAAKIAP